MLFRVILVGNTKKSFLLDGEEEYLSRLKHYAKVETIVIPDLKNAKNMSVETVKVEEGKAIMSHCKGYGPIVLLDENGKQRSSEKLAMWLQNKMNQGGKYITFVIGGAYGFSEEVYQIADEKISLSDMTFSHQMVRMIFFEQLYRALTILRGEPYHHK